MESIFNFLLSYFSIIFWAKDKISKSINLFLSYIWPKWFWPVRLQDFKSNISLEQSDEIVYFFACWHWILRVDRKTLGGCGQKWLRLPWSHGVWMNWVNFLNADANSGKLRITLIVFGWKIYFLDEWIDLADSYMLIHIQER